MRCYFFIILFLFFSNSFGQTKFKIKRLETKSWKSVYYIVDEKGEIIKELDSTKYIMSMNDEVYKYFAVFAIKGESDWSAIDINEKILFKIYNTSIGEPSPDELIENKIRIIDKKNKIGFADYMGNIIIKTKFEIATSFHKGKAIIGESCYKIPWDEHAKESDCQHYSIVCKRYGYIDENGEILVLGNFTFDEIQNKIK